MLLYDVNGDGLAPQYRFAYWPTSCELGFRVQGFRGPVTRTAYSSAGHT